MGFSYNKYSYQQITMIIHEHATEWWHKWWSKIALKQIQRSWKCITKMVQDCYTYNKCQIILSQDCFKIKSTSIEFFYHDDEKHKNTFIECSIMMMFKDCFILLQPSEMQWRGQLYKQMSIHLHLYTLINLTYK